MASANHVIIGLHIQDRITRASEVQRILTQYGCNIKTRLGLHEVNGDVCSGNGVVILELTGAQSDIDALITALKATEGVDLQTMIFKH
jgi:ACT domain-containing protein